MPITASEIVSQGVQRDGRKSVIERHTDHLGAVHQRVWLAPIGADLAAALAAWALKLGEDLQAGEISRNVGAVVSDGRLAVYSLDYSTAAQNFAALREAYAERDARRSDHDRRLSRLAH